MAAIPVMVGNQIVRTGPSSQVNGVPASQNLRSACRAVSWRSPSVETATRSLGFFGQALVRACGQLSSCDSFSEVQADGADELDLPDQLIPREAYRHYFDWHWSAPRHGKPVGWWYAAVIGSRPKLRSPAGATDRTMPAARNASGRAQDVKAFCRAARHHATTACAIHHSGQLCATATARN